MGFSKSRKSGRGGRKHGMASAEQIADRDELDAAYENGDITKEQHERAL